MKIVHLELAGFYTENMIYQTNLLTKYNRLDGHETIVLSTNFRWEGAEIVRVPVGETIVEDGIRLIRMAYANPNPSFFRQKFRRVPGLYQQLEELAPDVILCHCPQFWSVLDVVRYKKNHPAVKFYADSHTDYYTSATNWLSLHILHRVYYRFLVQRTLPHLEKFLYTSPERKIFAMKEYHVPEELLEFYPLGGEIFSDKAQAEYRHQRREELGMEEGELLLIHAGKLEPQKKTAALLRAFAAVPELKAKLGIIGEFPEDIRGEHLRLVEQDSRVRYLGWRSGQELMEYLCAADLYCQPGKVSAILENAVCCGVPAMLYPHRCYAKELNYDNLLFVESEEDIISVFRRLAAGEIDLEPLRRNSVNCAHELLDYRALAARLYR